MKYRYHVVRLDFSSPQALQTELDRLGDRGWELVAVLNQTFYFKKEVAVSLTLTEDDP